MIAAFDCYTMHALNILFGFLLRSHLQPCSRRTPKPPCLFEWWQFQGNLKNWQKMAENLAWPKSLPGSTCFIGGAEYRQLAMNFRVRIHAGSDERNLKEGPYCGTAPLFHGSRFLCHECCSKNVRKSRLISERLREAR